MGAPRIKLRTMDFFWTKSAWQTANGLVWLPQVHKPPCLIRFWVNPFFSFPLSGVIRNGLPSIRMRKLETFWEQTQLNRLQMVQFECPNYRNPLVSRTSSVVNVHSWFLSRRWKKVRFRVLSPDLCVFHSSEQNELLLELVTGLLNRAVKIPLISGSTIGIAIWKNEWELELIPRLNWLQ